MAKNYHATTGIDSFYYGVLNTENEETIIGTAPERIKFLQEISVSQEQNIEKAYGDNRVAEIATANGTVEVESQFHKLPVEDRVILFGLEQLENGLYAYGNTDNPPYIGAVFAKTHEDGSREWVGLPKGKFTKPEQSNKTKEDGVEFSSDSMTAEFMDRKVAGFAEEKSVIFGRDEKGSTAARDAIFMAVFGTAYPADTTDTTPLTDTTPAA